MVHCEHYNVGCKAKMCRKDLKEHNKLKVQERLASNTLKLNNLEHLVYRLAVNDISETSEDEELVHAAGITSRNNCLRRPGLPSDSKDARV